MNKIERDFMDLDLERHEQNTSQITLDVEEWLLRLWALEHDVANESVRRALNAI